MSYDAFISYSQAADGDLAPAIQKALQRFAKPWQKRSAMRVFRDTTGLSATPDLWHEIVDALDTTNWFILLASPGAAESKWVKKEIAHFLERRPDATKNILIVVTEGTCEWDSTARDFTAATTCIPATLRGKLKSEPLYLDLRWATDDSHLTLRNLQFRAVIAGLASAIRGIPKDELDSEDLRIFRRNRRLRRGAVSGLVLLAAGLGFASCAAFGFAKNAERERDNATAAAEEAQRQEALAVEAQDEAEREAARALTAEQLAQDNADKAEAEAIRAGLAEQDAEDEAERARLAEQDAEDEAERARLAEQEALDAQAATEAALEQVIAERDRADANRIEADENAAEAEANAAEALANAEIAEANAAEASDNATVARSRELAARSELNLQLDPELAALYAVESVYPDGTDRLATTEAYEAVGVALTQLGSAPFTKHAIELTDVGAFAAAAGSDVVAVYRDGAITVSTLSDASSTRLTEQADIVIPAHDVERIRLSYDGSLLAYIEYPATPPPGQARRASTVVHDARTGQLLWRAEERALIAIDRQSSLVALTTPGDDIVPSDLEVVSAMTGELIMWVPSGSYVGDAEFSLDGTSIAMLTDPWFTGEFNSVSAPLGGTTTLSVHPIPPADMRTAVGVPVSAGAGFSESPVLIDDTDDDTEIPPPIDVVDPDGDAPADAPPMVEADNGVEIIWRPGEPPMALGRGGELVSLDPAMPAAAIDHTFDRGQVGLLDDGRIVVTDDAGELLVVNVRYDDAQQEMSAWVEASRDLGSEATDLTRRDDGTVLIHLPVSHSVAIFTPTEPFEGAPTAWVSVQDGEAIGTTAPYNQGEELWRHATSLQSYPEMSRDQTHIVALDAEVSNGPVLSRQNVVTGKIDRIPLAATTDTFGFGDGNDRVVVSYGDGTIEIVDFSAGRRVPFSKMPVAPQYVALSVSGEFVFAVTADEDLVIVRSDNTTRLVMPHEQFTPFQLYPIEEPLGLWLGDSHGGVLPDFDIAEACRRGSAAASRFRLQVGADSVCVRRPELTAT